MNNGERIPGMKCPVCEQFIPISAVEIMAAMAIMCPHCGLRLSINRQESSRAIEALKKVDAAQRRVDESSKFSR